MSKLTAKQQSFCDEYLIDLSATHAAIRAGYSKKTARVIGQENLLKPAIKTIIDKKMAERAERTQITADYVLIRLGEIESFDIREMYNEQGDVKPVHEWSDLAARVVSGLDISNVVSGDELEVVIKKLKMESRTKALELAGKHTHVKAFDNTIQLELPPRVIRNFMGRGKK